MKPMSEPNGNATANNKVGLNAIDLLAARRPESVQPELRQPSAAANPTLFVATQELLR